METLSTLGFVVVAYTCGWLTWKYFENDYKRLKETGGPEWARIDRLTTWSVIAAAIGGGILVSMLLIWMEGR